MDEERTVTREHIIDFLQQAGTMLQHINQNGDKLNQAKATKTLIEAQGEPQKALQVAASIAEGVKVLEQLKGALFVKTKRDSVEGAELLLKDISERLTLADQSQQTWRQLLAALDVASRTAMSGEERAEREIVIGKVKVEYEAALAAAADLVPSPGLVLL
jgi:hypothetical protein